MGDISGASFSNNIAGMASGMKAQDVSLSISTALIKQLLDQQQMMGDALASMMQQSPSFDPQVGTTLDISA
jgi:hypothetical protein